MGLSKRRLEQQATRLLAAIIHDELQDPRLPTRAHRRHAKDDHAHRFIQDELAHRMKLRRIPRLRFVEAKTVRWGP
jgi:ribosome-binding factor A